MKVLSPGSRTWDVETARTRLGTVGRVVRRKALPPTIVVTWDDGATEELEPERLFPMPGAKYFDLKP